MLKNGRGQEVKILVKAALVMHCRLWGTAERRGELLYLPGDTACRTGTP